MKSRIRTHKKSTREQTQDFSIAPTQGMFQSRPFVVQTRPAEKLDKQPDLKTSLLRAKRYGHHLSQMHPISVSSASAVQPRMRMGKLMAYEKAVAPQRIQNQWTGEAPIQRMMLVIGGPTNPNPQTQDDQYISHGPEWVERKYGPQGEQVNLPDKFGGRGLKGWRNWPAKIRGNIQGTEKHGPRKSFKPQNDDQRHLSRLQPDEALKIVAHGTLSGKVGGYTPKKLVKLLVNLGLNKTHRGTLDLHACLSAWHNSYKKKSSTLLVEEELSKHGINMSVRGFEGLIKTTQDQEHPPEYELADLEYDKAVKQFLKSGGELYGENAADDKKGTPKPDTGDSKLAQAVVDTKNKRDAIAWRPAVLRGTQQEKAGRK